MILIVSAPVSSSREAVLGPFSTDMESTTDCRPFCTSFLYSEVSLRLRELVGFVYAPFDCDAHGFGFPQFCQVNWHLELSMQYIATCSVGIPMALRHPMTQRRGYSVDLVLQGLFLTTYFGYHRLQTCPFHSALTLMPFRFVLGLLERQCRRGHFHDSGRLVHGYWL